MGVGELRGKVCVRIIFSSLDPDVLYLKWVGTFWKEVKNLIKLSGVPVMLQDI